MYEYKWFFSWLKEAEVCVPRFPKYWTQSSCLTTLKQFYLHYRHIKHLDPDPKGIWIHAYWYAVQEINKKTVYSKTPCRDALGTVYRVPAYGSMRTGMLFKKSTTKTGYRKTPCRDALGISCTCCEESATRGTRTGKTRWWWRGWRQGRGRWYDIWPPLTRRRPPRSRWNTWSKSRQWRYSRAERSIGRVQRTERKKRFFHRLNSFTMYLHFCCF